MLYIKHEVYVYFCSFVFLCSVMYAWMKAYSATYFLFQINLKLVLIINIWHYINFHGNKLGSNMKLSPKKKKKKSKKPDSNTPWLFKQMQKDFGEERVEVGKKVGREEECLCSWFLGIFCLFLSNQTNLFSRSYDRLNKYRKRSGGVTERLH